MGQLLIFNTENEDPSLTSYKVEFVSQISKLTLKSKDKQNKYCSYLEEMVQRKNKFDTLLKIAIQHLTF